VLRIEGVGGSALLLGDIEREIEARLATSGTLKSTSIVVVPHHGSNTSSTQYLTQTSTPKLAVISAGFGNRWGFPKQEVVERWQAVGARTLKTSDSGAIEIAIDADGLKAPREYRLTRGAYWRR
jgi:competence protein ComEC